MPDLPEKLVDYLDVAGARVGEPTYLTTAELVKPARPVRTTTPPERPEQRRRQGG